MFLVPSNTSQFCVVGNGNLWTILYNLSYQSFATYSMYNQRTIFCYEWNLPYNLPFYSNIWTFLSYKAIDYYLKLVWNIIFEIQHITSNKIKQYFRVFAHLPNGMLLLLSKKIWKHTCDGVGVSYHSQSQNKVCAQEEKVWFFYQLLTCTLLYEWSFIFSYLYDMKYITNNFSR